MLSSTLSKLVYAKATAGLGNQFNCLLLEAEKFCRGWGEKGRKRNLYILVLFVVLLPQAHCTLTSEADVGLVGLTQDVLCALVPPSYFIIT